VNSSLTPLVTVATYGVMIAIGAMNASYGAVLPFLEKQFVVSSAEIGFLSTAQTIGGVLGNLSTAFLEKRLTAGQQMFLGGSGFAFGAVFFAVAMTLQLGFVLALLALFIMGLGLGLFQVNYANIFSKGFGTRSGAVMSFMSTAFAVGSIAGPILAVWLATAYAWLPVAFGMLTMGCAVFMRPARNVEEKTNTKARGGIDLTSWLFAGMIAMYVVAEQGAGFWGVTHLVSIGWKPETAAVVFSSFWLVLLVGRLVGAAIATKFSSEHIMLVGLLGSSLAFLLANIPGIAAPAYLLAGFLFAPVFPIGLTWLAKHNPSNLATTQYLIAGSVGAAVGTPLVGGLKTQFGDPAIPIGITIACALSLLLAVVLYIRQTQNSAGRTMSE
jgi:MFS transporter, FHS family, glucose/mannose:H+ symporter